MIATFPSRHYDIENYPAVKNYLLSFGKERLEQTGLTYEINGKTVKARKKTNNKWFETQDSISYWEDFAKPKIVYPDICTKPSFHIDCQGYLISNTAYMITTPNKEAIKHICKILNSDIMNWYYRTLSVQLGKEAVRMFSIYVLNIPIPPLSDKPIEEILELTSSEQKFIRDNSK